MHEKFVEPLQKLLLSRGNRIREKWLRRIIDTYPSDSSHFLLAQKDQFMNPVGATFAREVDTLFREFCGSMDQETVMASLDSIVRIRAVQDFSPSEALDCIACLKQVLREELLAEAVSQNVVVEYLKMEDRIDGMIRVAFGIYMSCREQLFEIRANQARDGVYKLLERMNRMPKSPAGGDAGGEFNE